MPKTQIPIITPDEKQLDSYSTSEYSKRQINGIFVTGLSPEGSKMLAWANRPGLEEWIDLGETGSPIDGLYWWDRQQTLVATCNGKTFFIDSQGTVNEKTGTAPMLPGQKPSYSDVSGDKLFQASSGEIGVYMAGAGNDGYYISDPQVPTNVTHLATLNKILIALPANTDRFEWAVVNNPESWDADYATAETSTDLARGLYVNNSEIIIPGQSSLEVWRDNGTTFVRELQGYLQVGIIAPDSFTLVNNEYFWLNQNRDVVRLVGRKQEIISTPYARFLKSLGTVGDARGSYLKVSGKNFYVLDFPTEGKTLVFDIENDLWCEWGDWNGTDYTSYIGNCFTEAPIWGSTVVGSRTDSKIYKMSLDSLTDPNGAIIRGMIRTDFLDHGDADINKFVNELILKLKRSEETVTNSPASVAVRYRDEGKKNWSKYKTINIEHEGTTDFTAYLRRLGSYKKRQYEFSFPDATDIMFLSATENVKYGR